MTVWSYANNNETKSIQTVFPIKSAKIAKLSLACKYQIFKQLNAKLQVSQIVPIEIVSEGQTFQLDASKNFSLTEPIKFNGNLLLSVEYKF